WDDFCAWYLELIKPGFQKPIGREAFERTKTFFEQILKLIHPFMPFISEELWHDELYGERDERDCCVVAPFPSLQSYNRTSLDEFDRFQKIVSEIRNVRNQKQISPKTTLDVSVRLETKDSAWTERYN